MSSTNRGAIRVVQDAYQTPVWAVELIKNEIDLSKVRSFLEPCKGRGNIYNQFLEIDHVSWCELPTRDYLKYEIASYWVPDLIITNPPFSLALEFLKKSLSEANTVIYLLRLNFLGSQARKEFWNANPPSHLFVLSKRPSFVNGATDSCEYAWFVFNGGNLIKKLPGIYVI